MVVVGCADSEMRWSHVSHAGVYETFASEAGRYGGDFVMAPRLHFQGCRAVTLPSRARCLE